MQTIVGGEKPNSVLLFGFQWLDTYFPMGNHVLRCPLTEDVGRQAASPPSGRGNRWCPPITACICNLFSLRLAALPCDGPRGRELGVQQREQLVVLRRCQCGQFGEEAGDSLRVQAALAQQRDRVCREACAEQH